MKGHLPVTQLLVALEPSTLFVKGAVRCATRMVLSHVPQLDCTPLEAALSHNRQPETVAFLEAAMVSDCGHVLPPHIGQHVVVSVWHPRLHTTYFPFVKCVAATLRMGCAHLCVLGGAASGRSLPFPIWGGDVMAYVGPLWEFLPDEELDAGDEAVAAKTHGR